MSKKKKSTPSNKKPSPKSRVQSASSSKSKKSSKSQRKPNLVKTRSHYNSVQKILSSYTRENDIHLGKDFNRVASKIHKMGDGYPLKYIEQNIEAIYEDLSFETDFVGRGIDLQFSRNVMFYHLKDYIVQPELRNVKITIDTDNVGGISSFSGGQFAVSSWFIDSGLYRYLRKNYNTSPTARFSLSSTDNKTYVVYALNLSDEDIPEQEIVAPVGSVGGGSRDKEIELELAKEKTKQLQLAKDLGLSGNDLLKFLGLV